MEYMRESRGPQGRHKGRVGQVGLSSLRRKNKQIALALLPAIMCSYIYSIYIYIHINPAPVKAIFVLFSWR